MLSRQIKLEMAGLIMFVGEKVKDTDLSVALFQRTDRLQFLVLSLLEALAGLLPVSEQSPPAGRQLWYSLIMFDN